MTTLMSIVESARLRGLGVTRYLRDAIGRIAGLVVSRLPEFLPGRRAAAEMPAVELATTIAFTN